MADNIPGGNDLPDVAARPLPAAYDDTRVSPEAYGAGAAGLVDRAAAQSADMEEFLRQERIKNRAARSMSAVADFNSQAGELIHNAKDGYLTTQGLDALAGSQKTLDRLDEIRGGIAAKLTPEQQDIFERHTEEVSQSYRRAVQGHTTRENEKVREKSAKALVASSLTGIANSYGDEKAVRDQMRLGETAIRVMAAPYGPEFTSQALAEYRGNALGTRLDQMLKNGQGAAAKSLFDANRAVLGTRADDYDQRVQAVNGALIVHGTANEILRGAATPVVLPNGQTIARLDPAMLAQKLSEKLDSLPADDPHRAAIEREVEQRQMGLNRVWTTTVAQQVSLAKQQGDRSATGDFSMSGVDLSLRAWLHKHDEDALIALNKLQDTEMARQRAAQHSEDRDRQLQQRKDSEAVASSVSAQIVDKDNRDTLLRVSPEEFESRLLKGRDLAGDPLPSAVLTKDISSLIKTYRQAQKDATANQLDEKPEATVKAAIARAADDEPRLMKELTAQYFATLASKAHAFIESHKGVVKTTDLEQYIDRELATGTVKGTGVFGSGMFEDNVRRIEAETLAKYAGKEFVVDDGQPDGPLAIDFRKHNPVEVTMPDGSTKTIAPQDVKKAVEDGATLKLPEIKSPRVVDDSELPIVPLVQDIPIAPLVQPAAEPQGKVRVIAPNGASGLIPADQLEAALKKGFRRG
jgi:hypothetical protein